MAETLAKICPKCSARYDAGATFCQKDGAILRLLEEEKDPRIGQTLLDQFRIEERIGAGGMGAVYRARQVTVGRDVAIKILHPDLASNADAVRRFQREARISVALDHPNVVRVFLFGQLPDGSLYLVMELLRGRPLADLLRVEPRLSLQRVMYIMTQVCDGVGEAHEQGIVHRDVKPENVFLVSKGRDPDYAKVLDFGIARILKPEEQTVLTQSGLVFGTARYISPEGAAGEPTDARSDVYSLGVLAYQMLCGETPFEAPAPVTLLMKHIHEPAPPLRQRAGGAQVPIGIADVVMRSLSKTPGGRYQDANEFGEVLRDAAAAAGINAGRPRTGSFGTGSSAGSEPSARESSQRVTAAPPVARTVESIVPERPKASSTTEELSIAGLRSTRRSEGRKSDGRPISTVIMAFVIGALAVVSTVFAVRALSGPSTEQLHAESVSRAEGALAAHRWNGADGVLQLTDTMIAANATDADALRIRRSAADALVAEGDHERDGGHPDLARERYESALAYVADHHDARERIQVLDTPVVHRTESIIVSPSPVAGEPVILTATTAEGHPIADADRPRFVILRDRRRVGRAVETAPTGIEGTYSATYSFSLPGAYTIEFRSGDGAAAYVFTTSVDVARGTRVVPSGGGDPPVTTQGSLGPLPLSPIPSIVDAPIIRPIVPALPSAYSTGGPPTTTTTPPPTIQPLAHPTTTSTTTTTHSSDPPALPPAWTSGGT
jgi:serine/threonine protein kinase